MYQITDVVKHLLILNVLMFFGTMLMGEPTGSTVADVDWGRLQLAMFYPTSPFFQPYQIVTHMFMHGDLGHLFFNMFALFMFGPPLEVSFGPRNFLFYYFFTGFGALGLYLFVRFLELKYFDGSPILINTPMLGASGAIFGLLLGYGMLFPNNILQLIFPPIALKAKYFVAIYAGIELFLGLGNFNTGVAHFAHLGGALFGLLLILYWRSTNR
ncbi:MAG TPA: rhomboid family intramembrane serine protease [Saprospiraceae bacterium]|nr:rhomboid family intramembrane serine protease [Saprospiraceae bacterium]HMQ82036.1 rhomboid family intramembrane serine protease [Saprospiraceae bacterium]